MFLSGDKLENGHYTVVKELGQGGMGVVYHCHDEFLQRDVALKMLLPELMTNQHTVDVFHQEARLAAQLEHPNIVTIFDIGKEERRHKIHHYIAMEYLPGGNLAGRIARREVSIEHTLNWMKQLANGLQFAHKKGVVHQDIKADNIFITLEGDLKIGDFGLARLLAGRAKTRSSHGMGTPAYMSPELCKGEPQDNRSDVYSMGVLYYEMATGDLPFKARGMVEMAVKHSTAPIPSSRKANPQVPEVLDKVIQKMMAKAPDDRYQSMAEVLTILDELIFELRVARLGLGPRVKAQPKAAESGFFSQPSQHAPQPGNVQASKTPGAETQLPKPVGHQVPVEPPVAEVAESIEVEVPPPAPLEKPARGKDFELLWSFRTQGPIGWMATPILSQDNNLLYTTSSDGRVYALDRNSGNGVWIFEAGGPFLSGPVLKANKLLVGCANGSLYALHPVEGRVLWRYPIQSALIATPCVVQDSLIVTTAAGKVLSLDVHQGLLNWQYQCDGPIVSSPQCSGNVVVVTSKSGSILALALNNGVLKWKYVTQGAIIASPAVSSDSVYVGGQDGSFYALDMEAGKLIWYYATDKPIISRGVIAFTSVLFCGQDRWLYCCEKYDGRLMWKSAVRGRVTAGLSTSGNTVQVVSREGLIQAFNSRSGELKWQLETGRRLEAPPLVTHESLYVGTVEGELMACSLLGRDT